MGATSPGTERRVFVGGMPFSYEVARPACMPWPWPPLPWIPGLTHADCLLYIFPAVWRPDQRCSQHSGAELRCLPQEDDVWEYWGYCGEIESLDLMRFPDTGRFKGICFITFKTVSS